MSNALAVQALEIDEQTKRAYMERRLKRWGRWMHVQGNNPRLTLEGRPNLIHRLMGRPWEPPTDYTVEHETNQWIGVITLLWPLQGAALRARYIPSPYEPLVYFNKMLAVNGYGNRKKTVYFESLSKGRNAVYGYLYPPLDCPE